MIHLTSRLQNTLLFYNVLFQHLNFLHYFILYVIVRFNLFVKIEVYLSHNIRFTVIEGTWFVDPTNGASIILNIAYLFGLISLKNSKFCLLQVNFHQHFLFIINMFGQLLLVNLMNIPIQIKLLKFFKNTVTDRLKYG